MFSSHKGIALAGFALILATSAANAAAKPTRVTVPDGPTVELALPDNWELATEPVGPAVTLRLSQAGGPDFLVLMTILPPSRTDELKTVDSVQKVVTEQGNQALGSALQTKLETSEVHGAGGTAFLYHVTDRNPEKGPGDYREANQGAMLLGKNVVTITILTHPDAEDIVELAKGVVGSLKIVAPAN